MEKKPLGKEEREQAEKLFHMLEFQHKYVLRDVLAAEAFWREKVKNLPEITPCLNDEGDYEDGEYPCGADHLGVWNGEESCLFCDAPLAGQQVAHKPDCAWALAQE